MTSIYNIIICRYGELTLKKGNRNQFENWLVTNISRLLRGVEDLKINRVRGRMWLQHSDNSCFTNAEFEIINTQLKKAFGLYSFSPAIMVAPEMDKIESVISETIGDVFDQALEQRPGGVTFKVRARRSDKSFPLNSGQIEIALAEIVRQYEGRDRLMVNLKNADITIGCEVRNEFAFIYFDNFKGPGGLPVSPKSPILALLSGGIDSPVACHQAMKRGCCVEYITFHSAPYTGEESIDKVKILAEMLNEYQKPGKLYITNLAPIQKLIRDQCNERFRTILYRRAMMRISERVASKTKKKALLTGEAIGQVASQTLDNMNTIQNATNMVIIRPLITLDKEDIIKIAEDIGTFETSIIPAEDSCTVFAPSSAATTSKIYKLEDEEAKIENYDEVLDQIIADIEVIKPDALV